MHYSDGPPYTEPYVRWLEGTGSELIATFLLTEDGNQSINLNKFGPVIYFVVLQNKSNIFKEKIVNE